MYKRQVFGIRAFVVKVVTNTIRMWSYGIQPWVIGGRLLVNTIPVHHYHRVSTKGIVKWYVEILDESPEPVVGVATILTMVRKAPDDGRITR